MQLGLDDWGTDRFVMKKLVFINSAFHCFTEIDIGSHIAVFGGNNKGKTSILNALKLFLLPETNFKDCKTKFAFRGKDGYYTGAQCHGHYFTDDRSFIVLEAENPRGVFCQVLYRSKNEWGYGRMLLPHAFDAIRDLFWRTDTGSLKNGGLGEIVPDLSLKNVLETLKQMGGIALDNKKDIQEALFQESEYAQDKGRFCLLPFAKQGSDKEIKAFRNLFQMAYDIDGKEKDTLSNAVAAVLEGEKRRDNEFLTVDFEEILREEKNLKEREAYLIRCGNQREKWQQLCSYSQDARGQADLAVQAYHAFAHALSAAQASAENEMRDLQTRKQDLLEQKTAAQQHSGSLKTTLDQTQGRLDLLQAQYTRQQQQLDEAAAIQARFARLSDDEICTELAAKRDALREQIGSLKDIEQAKTSFQAELTKRNQAQREIEKINADIQAQRDYLPDFLPDSHSRNVLTSLNADFAGITQQPDADAVRRIEAFAELFGDERGKLAFLGETLANTPFRPYRREQQQQLLLTRLDEAKQEYEAAGQKMDALRPALSGSPDNIAAALNQAEADLNKTQTELNLIRGRDGLQADFFETQQQCQETEQQLAEYQLQYEAAQETADEAAAAFAAHDAALRAAQQRFADYPRFENRLMACYAKQSTALDKAAAHFQAASAETGAPNESSLHAVETAFDEWQKWEQRRDNALRDLLQAQVLPENRFAEYAFMQAFDADTVAKCEAAFNTVYQNLDTDWALLRSNIESHAKESLLRVQDLEDAARQIHTFESEINQEFRQHKISDLSEIRVQFGLHPNFQQLLNELDKTDRSAQTFHSQSFYELLHRFSEQFFSKSHGRGTLNMENIIASVRYTCCKAGETTFTDTPQSTGTTTMINCLLLSALLKRLMRRHTVLTIPLVVDEIGRIDHDNLQEFVRIAEKYGFAVFGTHPEQTPKVIAATQRYFNIEYFAAEFPYHPRNTILYCGDSEQLVSEAEGA